MNENAPKDMDRPEVTLQFCTADFCWEQDEGEPGNKDVAATLANHCGVAVEQLRAGATIEWKGRKVRVECSGCLGGCGSRPRVNISSPEKQTLRTSATSVDVLQRAMDYQLSGPNTPS